MGVPATSGTTNDGTTGDQSAKAQVKDKAQDLAGQAREQAGQATDQARGRLRDEVDQRSTQAGRQVSTQAEDLRSVAQSLREQGKDQPAKLAEQAAQRAEQLGGYLERSDADRILSDVEDFARRRPWAVGLAAAAAGFAGARFLKASSNERHRSDGNVPELTGGGAGAATAATTPTPTQGQPPTAHPVTTDPSGRV